MHACVEITIICNFFDIDPYKVCNILNELFEQHNISHYSFDPFFKLLYVLLKTVMTQPLFLNQTVCKNEN